MSALAFPPYRPEGGPFPAVATSLLEPAFDGDLALVLRAAVAGRRRLTVRDVFSVELALTLATIPATRAPFNPQE